MQLSEQTKIESQIGFTIGILIGATAAGVSILFLTEWAWYFKVFSAIGSIGIIGSLWLTLSGLLQARRNYLSTLDEMKKMQAESSQVIGEKMEFIPLTKEEAERTKTKEEVGKIMETWDGEDGMGEDKA